MKSKGGSLYEVLKSASRPSGDDGGAPTSPEPPASPSSGGNQATLQERLAAYKAAKLAAANEVGETATESALARVTATTLVLEPDPTPTHAPMTVRAEKPSSSVLTPVPTPSTDESEQTPLPSSPNKGLGERVVRLTYNTVLFGSLIVAGLLFISYAVGLHAGKSAAAGENSGEGARMAPAQTIPSIPPRPPVPPLVPKKEYAIRLGEWKTTTAQDRVKALALAEDLDLKKTLERAGHKNFEKAFINRGPNDVRMALYIDRFSDLSSEQAKAALTAMKNLRFKNATPFDKAVFEEMQAK